MNTVIRTGLVLGLSCTVWMFVVGFAGWYKDPALQALFWVVVPIEIGVLVWGLGHLFANGEGRSIVLFGGLALWALVEMVLINRRDGAWLKPDPAPRKNDLVLAAGGFGAYVIVAMSHQWLFGFSPFIG